MKPGVIAEAAMKLCGADFHLHGRDAEHGLDCIGVAAQCLDAAGIDCDVPSGYSIRSGTIDHFSQTMKLAGFEDISPKQALVEGDIILARVSPVQLHMLIRASDGFVHAHAGLGKVAYSPGEAPWPIVRVFRFCDDA